MPLFCKPFQAQRTIQAIKPNNWSNKMSAIIASIISSSMLSEVIAELRL